MTTRSLLEREIARLNKISEDTGLNLNEIKSLDILLKNLAEQPEAEAEPLNMTPDEITEELRKLH